MKGVKFVLVGLVAGWWFAGMYYTSESSKKKLASEYARKLEKELEEQTFVNSMLHSSFGESVKERAEESYEKNKKIMYVMTNYDNMTKQQILKTLGETLK